MLINRLLSIGYTKLLVGVGVGNSGIVQNSIEIIDLASPSTSCEDLTNFPIYVSGAIGGLTPNKNPIICGGRFSDCYSYEDGVWNSSSSMTTSRSNAAASLSPFPNGADNLFVTGGVTGSQYLKTAEALSDDGWQQISTSLPVTISQHCMVILNSTTVLIIGGLQSGYLSPKTYFFNTEINEWVKGPKLLLSRNNIGCGKLRKDNGSSQYSVIVAGGYDGSSSMSSVEILDVGASEWRTGPNLPIDLYGASMVEDPSGGVVLIGGYKETSWLDTLYQLSHANSEWVLMPQKLKNGRYYATTFLVPDEITNCN